MKKTRLTPRFVVCINNAEYPAALELHKIYRVRRDELAAKDDFVRVVDESGEDYLYSADRFVPVELPPQAQRSMARHGKKPRKAASGGVRSVRTGISARRSPPLRPQRAAKRRV